MTTDGSLRQAASVIAGRDAPGLEVLVLERAATSRFLPGYVAFPGGSIEAEDADLGRRWFGSDEESRRACVVRELVEECGLAITGGGVIRSESLDPVDAAPPDAGTIVEIAHWIAPESIPVRFDARYFAVEVSAGLDPRPDEVETTATWWATPADVLDDWEAQRRRLYWPTYFTMRALATCLTVADLLALRLDTREPDDQELEWLHRSTFFQE
ncbi:MAG TPA: NUDIX domain-containing protein [Actinomycetota bacterium]|nr:NUDIX domain-containing protein [Actinomycetota bacterium]